MQRMPPRTQRRPRRLSSGESERWTPERIGCDVIIVDHDTERSAARGGEDVISGSVIPQVAFNGEEESTGKRMDGDEGARCCQLDAPTTCEPWDVRTLLNHIFVGAARGEEVTPSLSEDPPDVLSDDPCSDFERARAETLRTFGEPGVFERTGSALGPADPRVGLGGIHRTGPDDARGSP